MSTLQINSQIIEEHGLTPEEYERIKQSLGREPTLTELGIFYTGRTAFTVGGEFLWSKIDLRAEDVPDLKAVQFRIVTRLEF